LNYGDPQILARANLASEDEDSAADSEHEKDNTEVTEHHDNGHHDNKVDGYSNGGVDEDDGNGRVDEDDVNHLDSGVDEDDGNHLDSGVDEDDGNHLDSGVDEDHKFQKNGGDSDDLLSYTDKPEAYEDDTGNLSVLTDIVSSSDEVVPVPGSRRKVQRGRH
jgi:hypothetical protein